MADVYGGDVVLPNQIVSSYNGFGTSVVLIELGRTSNGCHNACESALERWTVWPMRPHSAKNAHGPVLDLDTIQDL
jgi:hypothetical protein